MRTMFIAMCALLSLGACISRQDQIVQAQNECAQYGKTPGTDSFTDCVERSVRQKQVVVPIYRPTFCTTTGQPYSLTTICY